MLIVGEKINGQFRKIRKAIDNHDEKPIIEEALAQVKAGANALDINTGPGLDDPEEVMRWMVETVQGVTDATMVVDTPLPKTMEAGLAVAKKTPIMNSTTAEMKKMEALFPLASKYDCGIICLAIDERGIARETDAKLELAMRVIAKAMEYDVPTDHLYLDPVVLPISAAQDQLPFALETTKMFSTLDDPPPHTIVGLSNVSSGAPERSLLNRVLLAMLMANGLDAAILDPMDTELMNVLKTAEVLLNKKLYAKDYLRA
jgi:5-methyltetrahydrofolate corrinoid/iron sulfur protein methyltransferase